MGLGVLALGPDPIQGLPKGLIRGGFAPKLAAQASAEVPELDASGDSEYCPGQQDKEGLVH